MPKFLFFLLLSFLHSLTPHRVIPVKDPNNITLSFGSCYSHRFRRDTPVELFYHIANLNPDVYIWLGDVAYVDKMILPGYFIPNDPETVREILTQHKNFPEYAALRSKIPVVGVWDDHDYGIDNGDKTFANKKILQELWLDYIDEPKDSPRRKQAGIYTAYYLGDPSRVKVVLLDVRYFRDKRKGGRDILGDAQWAWLEEELRTNTARYIVIGTGTQVFPDDRVTPEVWYQDSKERLFGLIRKHKVSRVILMSGDVHFSEILSYPCKERVGYELVEFTSSGLSHKLLPFNPWIEGVVMTLYPETYNKPEDRYPDRNFGVIRFEFGEGVTLETWGKENKVELRKKIGDGELEFDEKILDLEKACVVDVSPWDRTFEKLGRELKNFNTTLILLPSIIISYFLFLAFIIYVIIKTLIWLFRAMRSAFKSKEKRD